MALTFSEAVLSYNDMIRLSMQRRTYMVKCIKLSL
jgi:hypothetical protein